MFIPQMVFLIRSELLLEDEFNALLSRACVRLMLAG